MCLIYSSSNTSIADLISKLKVMFVAGYLSGLGYMCLGFLLSSLIKSPSQATGVFFGTFFITYIVGIVSKMVALFSDFSLLTSMLIRPVF
jgi:ABC-2 type transport system permease protein